MGNFILKGPVLWCDEESHEASKNLEWSGACHSCVHSPATSLPIEHCATKEAGTSREALFHILTTSEDPETFLRQRSLSCPVVLVSEENCMIAVGSTPLTTFQKEQFDEGLLYLMAYYYVPYQVHIHTAVCSPNRNPQRCHP
ncbi:hypothetical protein KUCAC02_001451 [Chaenocephalus aceratus]|uniref:Uncharacterized protein n=1 Tax=Chaenocephalus aceratus TaxID=36190 RepID=A0ACB9XS06_CHAAC|nr:hypothetical protein KUCAC02_001451 [Chaenocephalus aceratus]